MKNELQTYRNNPVKINFMTLERKVCWVLRRQEIVNFTSIAQWLASWAPFGAAMFGMLDGSFIQATSAIHLITVVPPCLLGLT